MVTNGYLLCRIADTVECSTIHRFQGRECDVVIIDLVDTIQYIIKAVAYLLFRGQLPPT